MKKLYFSTTLVVLALSAAFLGYGAYLNSTSQNYIETMLASRSVTLSGVKASYRDMYPELKLNYISLYTTMQADAFARIEGEVKEVFVAVGQEVKEGQPVCRLENAGLPLATAKADTDIAKAEASYIQSKSAVARNTPLAAKGVVPASELELSIAQMKVAKAELDAAIIARKQIDMQKDDQTVRAPFDGTVNVIYRRPGDHIDKGMPVALLSNYTTMFFTKQIPDDELQNIMPPDGNFSLSTSLANMTEKAFNRIAKAAFSEDTTFGVRVVDVLPPLTESAPIRSVTFELDNYQEIMEIGVYIGAVIRRTTPKRALAVPGDAVSRQGRPSVYILGADSRLAVRAITTGVHDAEYVEVTSGLNEGDTVITSGVAGLDPGVAIEVVLEEAFQ